MENQEEKNIKKLFYISRTIMILAVVFFLVSVYAFFKFNSFFEEIPSKKEIENISLKQTSNIYDKSGNKLLYQVHGDENRTILSHEEIPDYMRLAIVVAEDNDFYSHHGIDVWSIFRALKENIFQNRISQGASTITQQFVKNTFLTNERTWKRKIREIYLALKMERIFTKDEILDLYLNGVSFGSNTYGIQSASKMFFGKDARNLTLDEVALLAALPKATTYYSPYNKNNEELVFRQKDILEKIRKEKLLDESVIDQALQINTLSKIVPPSNFVKAPHFVFYLLENLGEKYGQEKIKEGGLEIISSIDYELQEKVEVIIKKYVDEKAEKFGATNAAAVILDTKTGEILAMAGSKNFFDQNIDGEVNVATSLRQPGSTIKPIVYASAFRKGYQPESVLWDVKTDFGPDGSGNDYIPENYNLSYAGLVTMRSALAMSLNVPAVKSLYLSGIDNFLQTVSDLKIKSLSKIKNPGLALALGGGEVSLLELTNAFRILGNDGMGNYPNPVIKIGEKSDYFNDQEKLIESSVARKINSILSDTSARAPVFGFSQDLSIKNKTVAVKTGTTQDYRDAWTVGYTPSVAVGVWVGNNDYSPMKPGSAGIYVAAPLWNELMNLVLEGKSNEFFSEYQKVESNNLMVTGKIEETVQYFNEKTGKLLSEKDLEKTKKSKVRERIVPASHSILYYVDKDWPLDENVSADMNDPMLFLWEDGIANRDKNEKKESDEE